jgi:hypothetical protein
MAAIFQRRCGFVTFWKQAGPISWLESVRGEPCPMFAFDFEQDGIYRSLACRFGQNFPRMQLLTNGGLLFDKARAEHAVTSQI